MNQKTVYVCDRCQKEFNDAERALWCEKNHLEPKDIVSAYHSDRGKGYRLPDKIAIRFSDDSVEHYSLDPDDDELDEYLA